MLTEIKGIPFDGGFGHKNLTKFEESQANNGANTGSTTRQNEYDQEPNRSDYAYDNNNMSGGAGQQTGGMRNNERGQGMNQGYNEVSDAFLLSFLFLDYS